MIRFSSFRNGQPSAEFDLASAYLFGSDGVPLRADIEWKDGYLVCDKRAAGPAGLAVPWPVKGVGTILLETTRLLERDTPYVLPVELARGHLMRLNHKREEWGLFDAVDVAQLNKRVGECHSPRHARTGIGPLDERAPTPHNAKAAPKRMVATVISQRVT